VVDVPAKLAAQVRLFDTGHQHKTDALDARTRFDPATAGEGDSCGYDLLTHRGVRRIDIEQRLVPR
jgi:hypothetical protein